MREVIEECEMHAASLIFVVDRWYCSTCAYSLGKEASFHPNGIHSIDSLNKDLFEWPVDLLKPKLVIQLQVDPKIRKIRVEERARSTGVPISDDSNPWDKWLNEDFELGQCIDRVFSLMNVPKVFINGNDSIDIVRNSAVNAIDAFNKSNEVNVNSRKPITLALFGPHTGGKKTIGQYLAKTSGFIFHEELGDLLRDKDNLVVDGHLYGNGSGLKESFSWDDRIYIAETQRDIDFNMELYSQNRIVETWHPGNLLWALQRKDESNNYPDLNENDRMRLVKKSMDQMICESQRGRDVFLVLLDINFETMIRRRHENDYVVSVLPMTDELIQCQHLHHSLGVRGKELFLSELRLCLKENNIRVTRIDNNSDGSDGIENVTKKILQFLNDPDNADFL